MTTDSQVHLCPVCEGKGTLKEEKTYRWEGSNSKLNTDKTCHGCDGKGWVIAHLYYVTYYK